MSGLELAPIHEGVEQRVGYPAAAQAVHGAGGDGRDDLLVRVRVRVRMRARARVRVRVKMRVRARVRV